LVCHTLVEDLSRLKTNYSDQTQKKPDEWRKWVIELAVDVMVRMTDENTPGLKSHPMVKLKDRHAAGNFTTLSFGSTGFDPLLGCDNDNGNRVLRLFELIAWRIGLREATLQRLQRNSRRCRK
jgi:hypothetical protein